MAAELAGQFVEIAAHLVLALAQHQTQGLPVLLGFRDFAGRLAQQIHQLGGRVQTVEGVLARAAVVHQTGLLQLRQMRRNLALALGEDLLQLGHRKLLLLQQAAAGEAGWDRRPSAAI